MRTSRDISLKCKDLILNDPYNPKFYLDYAYSTYSKWVQLRTQEFLSGDTHRSAKSPRVGLNVVFLGDSHSDFISRDLEIWINEKMVKIDCYLGPITAYRVMRDGLNDVARFLYRKENIILCPCFGEIDLRMHWKKYINTSKVFEYSQAFASRYCERLVEIRSQIVCEYAIKCQVIVVCPPPPRRRRFLSPGDDYYPQASDEERLLFHNCFRA